MSKTVDSNVGSLLGSCFLSGLSVQHVLRNGRVVVLFSSRTNLCDQEIYLKVGVIMVIIETTRILYISQKFNQ